MKKEIILKGKGFTIRPYKKSDYISIAENANNKKIARNLLNSFPSPYTEKDAKEWISSNLKLYRKKSFLNFVIDIDGVAVGTIGSSYIRNNNFMITFGYWLGEKYWRKGIVSNAVDLYTKYIFKTFKNIERIEAFTFYWNEGSQRVLLKNGFKFEGKMRKNYCKDGKVIDTHVFSKLRNER